MNGKVKVYKEGRGWLEVDGMLITHISNPPDGLPFHLETKFPERRVLDRLRCSMCGGTMFEVGLNSQGVGVRCASCMYEIMLYEDALSRVFGEIR